MDKQSLDDFQNIISGIEHAISDIETELFFLRKLLSKLTDSNQNMATDELNKYKWLDAQEVRPPSFRDDNGNNLRQMKKILEFLTED